MHQFIMGAIAMGSLAAGVFFLRFWKETRDQLFLLFALAFWVLGLLRMALCLFPTASETSTYLYLVRLLGYLLILGAILRKNKEQ